MRNKEPMVFVGRDYSGRVKLKATAFEPESVEETTTGFGGTKDISICIRMRPDKARSLAAKIIDYADNAEEEGR